MKLFSEFREIVVSVTSMMRASTTTGAEMDNKMYIIFLNIFICNILILTHFFILLNLKEIHS